MWGKEKVEQSFVWGKYRTILKASLLFLLCISESKLARNSPHPVLHSIFSVEPQKYFRVADGKGPQNYRCGIPLYKYISHAVCKGDKGTESLNARNANRSMSFKYSEMFLSPTS